MKVFITLFIILLGYKWNSVQEDQQDLEVDRIEARKQIESENVKESEEKRTLWLIL